MFTVPAGGGELHRDVPTTLCLLASEHSAGLTGKDSFSTLPPSWFSFHSGYSMFCQLGT